MTRRGIDLEKLSVALRRISRGNLLIVAERAAELVPRTKLRTLVGDPVRLDDIAEGKAGAAPLLDKVWKFHGASARRALRELRHQLARETPGARQRRLVLDAGTCEAVSGPDGPELVRPLETTLFHQVAAPGSPRGEGSGGAHGQGAIDECRLAGVE